MQCTIDKDEINLNELIDAALKGEDVVILRDHTPVVRLVPVETAHTENRRFRFGVMADKLKGPGPDFMEPMSEEELALWEGRPGKGE